MAAFGKADIRQLGMERKPRHEGGALYALLLVWSELLNTETDARVTVIVAITSIRTDSVKKRNAV